MRTSNVPQSGYNWRQSYDWNYDHVPGPVEAGESGFPGEWNFCGLDVDSPLGVPAGPLLNGAWCLYYASLGFDVLTYKTVRSCKQACYPMPNLQPVSVARLDGGERGLETSGTMDGTWAVSFGMPSRSPDVCAADVEATRDRLPPGKLLCVSVVGTVQAGWDLDDLARDYAQCARWAVESGADAVESNFSCPNVSTCDGQLYQSPAAAARVAQSVRQAVGDRPYLIKIGHVRDRDGAIELIEAIGESADALAMTNSVAATVRDPEGQPMFGGQLRGICGAAIRETSTAQVRIFADLIRERHLRLKIVGVGGAGAARHVREYLDAGAHAVHLATAAMVRPGLALEIRRDFAAAASAGTPRP